MAHPPPPTRKLIAHDLERLTQQQVAWLIGRSGRWLRDAAHEIPRNADGTYNARLVVAAMLKHRAAEQVDDRLVALLCSPITLNDWEKQQHAATKKPKRARRKK